MEYRVDVFNGNGGHTIDYFTTKVNADAFATKKMQEYPDYHIFLLKEIKSMRGFYDVIHVYGKEN